MILGVMVGGALGALCRYLVNVAFLSAGWTAFPLATFAVNIVGSFLLSLLFFNTAFALPPGLRTAIGTGFLGALTTFSTFELETFTLLDKGQWLIAVLYSLGSITVGLLAVLLGRWAALQLS